MSYLEAKPSSSSKGGQARDPPPALFLHPSREASHVSLPGAAGVGPGDGPNPNPNPTASASQQPSTSQTATTGTAAPGLIRTITSTSTRTLHIPPPPRLQKHESTRATDRTDALWAEMQATLEDVQLSASGGTRIFGPAHDRGLAELRAAQIALAHAWARSEADDAFEANRVSEQHRDTAAETEVRNLKGALGDMGIAAAAVGVPPGGSSAAGRAAAATGAGDHTDGGRSTVVGGTGTRPGSSAGAAPGVVGGERLGTKLEEETQADILLARKRREANDRYFSRVDQGVRDVVARLEEVAVAMRSVEQETREAWGDEDNSAPGSAKT
ncbi:hypothetical protein DL768_011090 [Monosporascus sp. mg162]|nr:hypothetical protein DL768_011090 [Monosporascus sp. mg162]